MRKYQADGEPRQSNLLGYFASGGGAFVGEEVLLGEAGLGAEVRAAEVGDLGGFPAVEVVAAGEGLENPRVDGEGFEAAGSEKENAVGDLFTDALECEQALFGFGVGGVFSGFEPTGVRGEETGDDGDVAGAKAERAGAKLLLGNGGEFRPSGQGVGSVGQGAAVAGGEQGLHLFDLGDLLGGTANEAEEGFAKRLAEDAQAGKGVHGGGQVGIAAPGQQVGSGGWAAQVVVKRGRRGCGIGVVWRGELKSAVTGDEANEDVVAGPLAFEGVLRAGVPAKGLPTVEQLGE